MVLESLINATKAEQKPAVLIGIGFLITCLAIIFAHYVFPQYASIVYVFFVVMASIPLMFAIIKLEEKKDISDFHETALLKEHGKALKAFMALFLGVVLGTVFFYVVAPGDIVGDIFSSQQATLTQINGAATGLATETVQMTNFDMFTRIFFNNVKVLIFCIIFSFLYGAGAIFILTWNASVIGVAIGNYMRSNFAAAANLVGFDQIAAYLSTATIGLLKYAIHGIPEILAYFVAGLAGGIISIAIIRHDFKGKKFEHIVLDTSDLLLLSLGILLFSAILEVWVTPVVF
jgi:uncharacterized membrane protein SpoIIM required for sporulation